MACPENARCGTLPAQKNIAGKASVRTNILTASGYVMDVSVTGKAAAYIYDDLALDGETNEVTILDHSATQIVTQILGKNVTCTEILKISGSKKKRSVDC